jgi:hypothetical protein
MTDPDSGDSGMSLQDSFDRVYNRSAGADNDRLTRLREENLRLNEELTGAHSSELDYKSRLAKSEVGRIKALGKKDDFLRKAEKLKAERDREENERMFGIQQSHGKYFEGLATHMNKLQDINTNIHQAHEEELSDLRAPLVGGKYQNPQEYSNPTLGELSDLQKHAHERPQEYADFYGYYPRDSPRDPRTPLSRMGDQDKTFLDWAANDPQNKGHLGLGYFGLHVQPVVQNYRKKRRRGTRRRRATHY